MTEPLILKGNAVAEKNKKYCLDLIETYLLTPHLYVLIVGSNPASLYYVESIKKQSLKYKINITVQNFQENEIDENTLLQKIQKLNQDPNVHGIMVQKPLPKHIDPGKVEQCIAPHKDVDGFHALNAGLILYEKECFLPCTAAAILEILDFYDILVEGKHVVVVGRSNVVGKPVANLLLYKIKNRNATVTVCHSRTPDMSLYTRQADIVIVAVGVPRLLKSEMIKDSAVIIDAGINELTDKEGKTAYVGDVDFEGCFLKCSAITPVPGGVGSVTTSILFKQLCISSKKSRDS
ncbi:MAG: bifunctional 5,10-methylenetetrahydrofolate dehydrogenase/5,10-methenyltetrahydrofolate cyclohydrolase [Candidatus Cloacimonetes bacterium]|nr:bifunctional 5,10-methylenetetrahydrofolate dehydrogenase/5,10-methenyltetrahydrofolate cyclohydrolase [Candidatus Cloacimonadota bacterium]